MYHAEILFYQHLSLLFQFDEKLRVLELSGSWFELWKMEEYIVYIDVSMYYLLLVQPI